MKKIEKLLSVVGIASIVGCGAISCSNKKELVGFDIDLAKEVGAYLDVDVKFQEIVWEQKEFELSSGNIDAIWNGFTVTEERKENLTFSVNYMENRQVVIGKKDNSSLISNDSKFKIAVESGSAGSDVVDSNDTFAECTKVEVQGQIDALTEVLSGTSDYAIIDSVMAGYYLAEDTSYNESLEIKTNYTFDSEYYGIGFRKGDETLAAKVNEALESIYTSGKTNEIATKYGLEDAIVMPSAYTPYSSLTDNSYKLIKEKNTLVIGYTVFAPIAFEK